MSTASTGDVVYGGALTINCGARSAGLRIDQDGRFLKGDFSGGVVASGASWLPGMLGLSCSGLAGRAELLVERL
jgi:hypothetical protein